MFNRNSVRRTISLLIAAVSLTFSGCIEGTASDIDAKAVNEQQKQYAVAQPIPKFDWSLERDVAIQLYQARNQNVNTYTVWRSDFGQILGDCPSVGYPIPYDVQLTNPLVGDYYRNGGTIVVEQAEPNGLYSSKNSIATWVRCRCEVDGKTVTVPVYIEDKVTTYPYPVRVDYENNRVIPYEKLKPSVTINSR